MLGTIDATYSPGPNYPGAGSYWPPAAQAYGEMRYRCPGLFVSDSQSRYRVNAWNYHYNVLAPDSISSGNGVTHTVETNAIWGPTNGSPSNYYADSPFVQAMQGYWISFIRSYDPNTFRYPGTIKWEQWQPWLRQSVVINNNGTAMEPCSSNLKSRCSYLQRIGVTIQQ